MRFAKYSVLALALGVSFACGHWSAARDDAEGKGSMEVARARAVAAQKTYEALSRNFRENRPPQGELLYRWSRRWLDAERDLGGGKQQLVSALRAHYNRMRELEHVTRDRFRERFVPVEEATAAQFFRLEAELWLVRGTE